MAEADLLHRILSYILVLIELRRFLFLQSVHIEMLIVHNDFLIEIINLFLLLLRLLFDHIVARDEDRLEVVRMRESVTDYLYFGLEVRFAVVSRHVLEAFQLLFRLRSLDMVRNRQLMHGELVRALRVLIPILSLHDIVEAGFGLPS